MKLHHTKRKLTSVTITVFLLCSIFLGLNTILGNDPETMIVRSDMVNIAASAPNAPTNPYPPHGSNGISSNPILSAFVTDPDSSSMNVSFYDASDDSLIGTDLEVDSGTNAWVRWFGLSVGSMYSWYAIAYNEMGQNRSDTWSFTVSADSGITAEYNDVTPPTLDGDLSDLYWSGGWDVYEVNSRRISIKVKHDDDNLYFAIQWVENEGDSGLHFYFEDDGSYPEKILDVDNEDNKYVTSGYFEEAVNQQFWDAHWEGWTVSGDARDGHWGAQSNGNWWYAEASIPLSTGSIHDINVTAPEILGFYFQTYYTSPSSMYPVDGWPFDASTWTYLHILPELGTKPDMPINITPPNGTTGVDLSLELSVNVSDPDGDIMDVSFYDASDNSLIGTIEGVASGEIAAMPWTSLEESTLYSWYVIVDDSINSRMSSIWNFTTLPLPPTWDEPPTDQYSAHGYPFVYNVSAYDVTGIDYYWLNDTTNFAIDGYGSITNATALSMGNYSLEIRVYDNTGLYTQANITITIMDIPPPEWIGLPNDQIHELGEIGSFKYVVDATSLAGIDYYWINDTINFEVDEDGTISNSVVLQLGIMSLEIRAYDTYYQYCFAIISITVQDTTAPVWDDNISEIEILYGETLSVYVSASDLGGIDYYGVDDTANFEISEFGLLTSKGILEVGPYPIILYAYDTSGNYGAIEVLIKVHALPEDPPSYEPFLIPGYDLMLMLGVLVVSVSIIGISIHKQEFTKK